MTTNPGRRIEAVHYRNILVAVDGSASSDLALATALAFARRDNSTISLVAVELDAIGSTAQWAAVSAPSPGVQEDLHRRCQNVLGAAANALPDDVSVTTYHRFGKAGPQIVAQADEGNYDLILLGARGVGRVGSILGSVSQHVLHHAKARVMVVHDPEAGQPDSE